jgi:catechol 2,3-dioxygenase-like lactoylglutathione lyase family enzyme
MEIPDLVEHRAGHRLFPRSLSKRQERYLGHQERTRQALGRVSTRACSPHRHASHLILQLIGDFMPRVVGIDHLVLSVGNFARSRTFYGKLLRFLGFKLKYDYADMAGWSNGKTLLWIASADAQGKRRKYRKGDIGFHHYAFELGSRDEVDELGAFLEKNGMTVLDPPGEYYGRNYYAVYFSDPDGMKLEGMIWAAPGKTRKSAAQKKMRRSGFDAAAKGRHAL